MKFYTKDKLVNSEVVVGIYSKLNALRCEHVVYNLMKHKILNGTTVSKRKLLTFKRFLNEIVQAVKTALSETLNVILIKCLENLV